MFITVKGEKDEEILVNINQIKFIVPRKNGCFIDFGEGLYIRSNSSVVELGKAIADRSKNA